MPKITEYAELHVNGMIFRDWESVMVRHAYGEMPPYQFRFTCSEGMPLAKNYAVMRIKPGDHVQVYLAGILAISGRVTTRQVFYDAFRHHIEIRGATYAYEASRKTVQSKTNEYNKVTYNQLAQSLLSKAGIGYVPIGNISNFQFPRVSVIPGQTIYEVLEQHSRHIGGKITSDPPGNFVTAGDGASASFGSDVVEEGKNILEGREVIHNQAYAGSVPSAAQLPGTNKKYGPDVTHVPHTKTDMTSPVAAGGPSRMVSEIPGWSETMMKLRSDFEGQNIDESSIYVTTVIHGWLRPSGGLWQRLQKVFVRSPMLIMEHSLILRAVTFTQDNNTGSRSTLELVNEKALGGGIPGISRQEAQR